MKLVVINDVVYAYAAGDPSANGGAERYQWLLARALSRAGWSITIGVHDALEIGQRETTDGVEFVGIGRTPILRTWYRFLSSEQPDWWHWQCASHWWGPAVEVAKFAGVSTIFSAMHDRDVQLRRSLFRRPQWWPLYAWGLARTDKIFVQHGWQLSHLNKVWRSKASILPGIVEEVSTPKPHTKRTRYVAWVGVVRQPKRPDLLLEIARRAPAVRFIVCGAPSTFMSPPGYGERIVEALKALPNVHYRGQVAPEEVLHIISEAAILLSTSDGEGFPSVFLEAWSSGTPVVSLRIDPDDIIKRFGLGTVSGNVDCAVTDIKDLIGSAQRRDEIGIRARRYTEEVHSETAVVKIFESAIGSRG